MKPFSHKKKQPSQTPLTCFKCEKPIYKARNCKVEQKVNEFADKPDLRDKVLAIMENNQTNYDQDFYHETNSDDLACSSSPIQTINVITNGNKKKLLFDLIGQFYNTNTKKKYLKRLRDLILSEEQESKSLKFNFIVASFSKIIYKYPHPTLFKQIYTKEIQGEINELKSQVCALKTNLFEVKTNSLELKAKLSLLENNELSSSCNIIETNNIEISKEETPNNQFLISYFQTYYSNMVVPC